MAHFPPQIAAFFQPRPPLPVVKSPDPTAPPEYMGVAEVLHKFQDTRPDPEIRTTPQQLKAEKKSKREKISAKKLQGRKVNWNPKKNPSEKMTGDAYKTLFVGRLKFELTPEDIKHEFEFYGPVKDVKLAKDREGKSRGYAFVEFERTKDFKEAYHDADGRKIADRRIVVDVERGRTVEGWLPRSLGGGLGGTRLGGKDVNIVHSGRHSARATGSRSSSSYSRRSGSPSRSRRHRSRSRDYRHRSGDRRPFDRHHRGDDRHRSDGRHRSRDRERGRDYRRSSRYEDDSRSRRR